MVDSVNNPPATGALETAVQWLESALTGAAATSIAIIAVVLLAINMLQGRIDLRSGGRVVIGAFILFGAPLIAFEITNSSVNRERASPATITMTPIAQSAPNIPDNAPANDPYAGAAVPQLQQ